MKALKSHGFSALNALKTPRFQPDYNDEVSEEYLQELRRTIDDGKPANFALTPICEPGW